MDALCRGPSPGLGSARRRGSPAPARRYSAQHTPGCVRLGPSLSLAAGFTPAGTRRCQTGGPGRRPRAERVGKPLGALGGTGGPWPLACLDLLHGFSAAAPECQEQGPPSRPRDPQLWLTSRSPPRPAPIPVRATLPTPLRREPTWLLVSDLRPQPTRAGCAPTVWPLSKPVVLR